MIRLSKSIIGAKELDAVIDILKKEFLGTGPETQSFEKDICEYLNNEVDVACVNTGTSALQLALEACEIGSGAEVLVPTLTYLASFQAISATGALPIPCDVLETSGLIDLVDAQKRITSQTKAIMPVHYAGYMGNLDAIYEFAKNYNLRVIEDAAHAFGSIYKNNKIGIIGDVVCFSFDGIKNITSGEGGAVVSANKKVIHKVFDARLLGVQNDSDNRYQRQRSWEFDVVSQGWRYHMSDIMAAIGRIQLSRFESEFKPKRMNLHKRYRENLSCVNFVKMFESNLETVVPHIMPIRIINGNRDILRQKLAEFGIQTGIHYKPNHLLSYYGAGKLSLPTAEKLYKELLTLPLHPDLLYSDIDLICDKIHKYV
jgi:dTDP-4-amino-4,6-dideoxygalactose transaminase